MFSITFGCEFSSLILRGKRAIGYVVADERGARVLLLLLDLIMMKNMRKVHESMLGLGSLMMMMMLRDY